MMGVKRLREIQANAIKEAVRQMFIKMNYEIGDDVKKAIADAMEKESSPLGKNVLSDLLKNSEIAEKRMIPVCQDTGMAVLFVEIGQEVHISGEFIGDAINCGVREAYDEGYLRKSVVKNPLDRINTKDNTPAVIHYEIIPGDRIKITAVAKGFGSENMSRIKMLNPSDGVEGVIDFVAETVAEADSNPCPPIVVGVGIGGTMEKAAMMAKKALARKIGVRSADERTAQLEEKILAKINRLGIGPQGFGGDTTALAVNVEMYPTHIAGLPVAVNINCHAARHEEAII